MNEHWKNKKTAFIGDSITDPACMPSAELKYWKYLADSCGLIPLVYGVNGITWAGLTAQAEKLLAEHGSDVDAVFVFLGTNDFNGGVPLGSWFDIKTEEVNSHGVMMKKPRRYFSFDPSTFCGRINLGLKFLKENFPVQQIVLLTPIHRGYACFSDTNVQPEESFPNDIGNYFDDYINCIKAAGNIWSVPVIDLNSLCGLFPVMDQYTNCFSNAQTDRLHPNSAGHLRIAEALRYQIQMLPSAFK